MYQKSVKERAFVVALTDVTKNFGPVRALNGVSVSLQQGDCLGLVGHNGAGKSTLVNVMNGMLEPSSGEVSFPSGRKGVRSIFQELSLCPNLTVAENLRISNPKLKGFYWRHAARIEIRASLDKIFPGHGINPDTVVDELSIAQRQMVEIAIGFARRDSEPKLVILDEPTSSLDATIASQLLMYVREFCSNGGAVIFISHMMDEIFDVTSRIVVLKDGKSVVEGLTKDFTRQSLVDAMGHVASGETGRGATQKDLGAVVVSAEGLEARQGEIVGLSGLAGHGQATTLAKLYFSRTSDWRASASQNTAFVAGDRPRDGILPLWSILRNASISVLKRDGKYGCVDQNAETRLMEDWQQRIGIRMDSPDNSILSLSGGNQQKVLFARALASDADVVIMDDPMRGVDVGTKQDVYAMIRAEAARGRTFLWYSTETEEVCQCDRVFVFRNGEISAELTGEDITEEKILEASFEMQEV